MESNKSNHHHLFLPRQHRGHREDCESNPLVTVAASKALSVEFVFTPDGGYPKVAGVTTTLQILGIPFAMSTLAAWSAAQSPPSHIVGHLGRGLRVAGVLSMLMV